MRTGGSVYLYPFPTMLVLLPLVPAALGAVFESVSLSACLAAAQVAAKDASLDEVSACLTKVRQDAQQAKQTADANLQEQQAAVLQRDGQLVELQSRLDTAVQEKQAAGVESQAVAVQLATVSGELRLVREQHQVNARR